MSGRYEHERKVEEKMYEGLDGFPKVMYDYAEESAGRQKSSKAVFVNTVKRFITYLRDDLGYDVNDVDVWATIKKRTIKDYFKKIKIKVNRRGETVELSSKTLNDYLISLNNFFEYLKEEEYITENPCPTKKEMSGIISDEVKEREVVVLTPEEVKEIRNHIYYNSRTPARDACIFILGCRTGLRAQALSDIDESDIDFENKKLTVIEKGKRHRTINLADDTIKLIRDCMREKRQEMFVKDFDPLFVTVYRREPRRISKENLAVIIEKYTAITGKHITPHGLRRTNITAVYNETGDIAQAARSAGHHNLANTMRYINTEEKDRQMAKRVAEIF